MKTDNDQKKVIEKYDRSDEPSNEGKINKNPATTNNVPFDEGQLEEPKKDLQSDIRQDKKGKDIHEDKGDLAI